MLNGKSKRKHEGAYMGSRAGQGRAGVGVYITVNIGIKHTNSVISYVFVAR